MNILHLSAECYPIAKVGGLADVVGALPKYQQRAGHAARCIMPFYQNHYTETHAFEPVFTGEIALGEESYPFSLLRPQDENLEIEVLLVQIPGLLSTDHVYSSDDAKRFLAFSLAALTWIIQQATPPDVVHCHDHHTGLVPFLMSHSLPFARLKNTPSVLTIHNAQYRGEFSWDRRHWLPEFPPERAGLLDWDGQINPLAAAIKCAWAVTTVSPGYLEEMKQQARGLEHLIRHEQAKCRGILNGIDFEVWDPETDPYLPTNYRSATVHAGKKANKEWLCEQFQIDGTLPLFVFIGRLVYEKGADVLAEALAETLPAQNFSVLLLGSGEPHLEARLTALKDRFPGHCGAYIGYNEELAHRLYAGGDFLLMPSRVEPCGLNQMYALRYGTLPIVRSVGGLKDTVVSIAEAGGFGIRHAECSVSDIATAIAQARSLWSDPRRMKKLVRRTMARDNSWEHSTKQYLQLYSSYIP
ncbi:MAG: glycogen synthase [Bacteroidota bacterium]